MKKKKINIFDSIGWRILLIFWSLVIIFPIGWIIMVSLKTNQEFYQSCWALPAVPQFVNYSNVWQENAIGRAFLNTIIYVGSSLALCMTFTYCCTYTLTRIKFKGRMFLYRLVMFSLFLPGINAMIPVYVTLKRLHMVNFTGLIFFSSCGIGAFNLMVLGGFLETIPHEMEESAYIDGAGYFRTMLQIIAPMAKPGLITILVFAFLGFYNSYLWPNLLLAAETEHYTIAVKLFEINKHLMYKSNWTGLCAVIVMGLVPSVVFYMVLQKYVVSGVTVGALKG